MSESANSLGALVLVLLPIVGYVVSIAFLIIPETAGRRVAVLTSLWMVVLGLFSIVYVSMEVQTTGGGEYLGMLLLPAIPWILVLSAITLVAGSKSEKLRLLSWAACLVFAALFARSPAAFVPSGVATILAVYWLVREFRG